MPLSSKLEADYIELINQALDSIPIGTLDEFETLSTTLKEILPKPWRLWHIFLPAEKLNIEAIPQKYRTNIAHIQGFLDSPESYVADSADYAAFKEIILSRIKAKIKELTNMTEEEKERYIDAQQTKQKKTKRTHEEMSKHTPPEPGSDAHTINQATTEEEQWLEDIYQHLLSIDPYPTQENLCLLLLSYLNTLSQEEREHFFDVAPRVLDIDASEHDDADDENRHVRPRHRF